MSEKVTARRCAVYTRKSSDEGLEQDFNSLDAQREACEAYIKSQAGEGWKLIKAAYDDGGISGGTMERPGLQKLIEDIRARKIDTVIVYKVDRLTRSLADFAKIVEVFDERNVSFVSVTQQFNTTTSMGRLTLNMLLSFAQFEREVTGERIRDKIAASKKKGMWMGGVVPLGYEPHGRTLKINDQEAETIRRVFELYLQHRNVRLVKQACDTQGLRTKLRRGDDGSVSGGRPMSRGYIYKVLSNPLYIGRIAHKGETYDGLHPAIIDQETWDAVQGGLAENGNETRSGKRVTEPSPLIGKLIDETGIPLSPSHAVKSGRRYRYYVSRSLMDDTAKNVSGLRLPAGGIEGLVRDAVSAFVVDRTSLIAAAREAGVSAEDIPALLSAVATCGAPWHELIERVELQADCITLKVQLPTAKGSTIVTHQMKTRIRRRGVEMRLVLLNKDDDRRPDPTLIKVVARAHRWFEDLTTGRKSSLKEIARSDDVSDRYVARLLPLAFLAPSIVEAILNGTQPVSLTAEKLTRLSDLPMDWADQRVVLGFK